LFDKVIKGCSTDLKNHLKKLLTFSLVQCGRTEFTLLSAKLNDVMKRILFCLLFFFTGIATYAQKAPVFNGKQINNVITVSVWDLAHPSPGWYRIEMRQNADHCTLMFETGVSFKCDLGSFVTVTSNNYLNTYAGSYLEEYAKPVGNNTHTKAL